MGYFPPLTQVLESLDPTKPLQSESFPLSPPREGFFRNGSLNSVTKAAENQSAGAERCDQERTQDKSCCPFWC